MSDIRDLETLLWPIAVVQDRYMGTYTGGKWVAIPRADYYSLDHTVWGDDVDAMEWAHRNLRQVKRVGVGATPDEALKDLLSIAESLDLRYDPEQEVVRLRDAIMAHRALVMADPANTEKAEEELWSALAPFEGFAEGY